VHAEGNEEEISEILTAAGEATANAIEHSGAASGVGVDVTGDVSRLGEPGNGAREVRITVRDRGSWRPRRGNTGGGRGLVLMRALMDDVDVVPSPEGTTVSMTRELSG
jgi:serine/threonine-protein kinase RsbW